MTNRHEEMDNVVVVVLWLLMGLLIYGLTSLDSNSSWLKYCFTVPIGFFLGHITPDIVKEFKRKEPEPLIEDATMDRYKARKFHEVLMENTRKKR